MNRLKTPNTLAAALALSLLALPALAALPAVPVTQRPLGEPGASRLLGEPVEADPIGDAEADPGLGLTQTVGSLAIVIGLIVAASAGARWLARKHGGLASQMGAGGKAPSGVAEVLARYPLARGQTVVLLRVGQRVLVTFHGVGGKNGPTMSLLSEVTDPEEVADLLVKTREREAEEAQHRFSAAIAEADARHAEARAAHDPTPRPPAFRTVQTSAQGDRVELLGARPAEPNGFTDRTGLDAVARLRERLAAAGGGS